jgi:hypothetical protein
MFVYDVCYSRMVLSDIHQVQILKTDLIFSYFLFNFFQVLFKKFFFFHFVSFCWVVEKGRGFYFFLAFFYILQCCESVSCWERSDTILFVSRVGFRRESGLSYFSALFVLCLFRSSVFLDGFFCACGLFFRCSYFFCGWFWLVVGFWKYGVSWYGVSGFRTFFF